MCILKGENFQPSAVCEKLRDVFVYIDFSGIFDRKPIGKVLEWQHKAEFMFKSNGIKLNFGKQDIQFIAFERSASMSRENRLSFVRADIYEALKERMMLGMNIGKCQLSKLYAYNALLFTSGRRIENNALLSDERIIVIDNPESIVPDVDIITVTDDGTDNPIRKYTRVETKADIKITEFDGEGLISKRLSNSLDSIHSSYQIRMPYIKGVVHEVDFASLFDELGVKKITDIFGNQYNPHDVDLIINKSMFKGYGWMLENNLTWAEYLDRCRKYNHALYISGSDKSDVQNTIELNYQFLNTLAMTTDEFRPADLKLGWNSNPEWDNREWITKTTETEYYKLVGDYGVRREHFLKNLESDDDTDKKKVYAKIIEKNAMFVDEPIYAKELQDKAKNILNKYAVGKLLVSGVNRYLCDDLMRLLGYIVKCSEGESKAYKALEKEFLTDNFMYAPKATYEENEFYTLLRSPHIARNEEALKRVRQIRHTSTDMRRKNDIYRILFARGQETEYSVDELYADFDDVSPSAVRKARNYLTENVWQFTPPDEREKVIYSLFTAVKIYSYADLFCDFSESGYRILGDIICDIDDMYRAMGLKKNLLHQKGDSIQMKLMLAGISQAGDYKAQIIRNCINVIRPIDRKKITLDYAEVVKCAVALGKRQFALEVLPTTVLELALDRSHVYKSKEEKPEKKRWFRR